METGIIIGKFARLEACLHMLMDDPYGMSHEVSDIIDRNFQKEWRNLERELGIDFDLFMDDLNERGFNAKRIYDQCVSEIMWRYENA